MAEKVLLDTDIGSDIDDAVCLAYLLSQPECELLGITTVTGEAVRRAQMASALCKLAGRDIPIYPGAERPLLVPQLQPEAPQAAMLDRWPHQEGFPASEAVDFLRQTIRQHPGEVTLLGIGPLTNIALLFALDPEIPSLLKRLVLMCGVFFSPKLDAREWNAMLDPHATAIVYRAEPPLHRSIGLDVTEQVRMDAAAVRQQFAHSLLAPVLDFAEVWFKGRPEITFHDPLAAATLFDENICAYQSGLVDVYYRDKTEMGQTHWLPGQGTHQIAVKVDPARFFAHYFSVFR
jgi:purine nucleosidase